VDLDTLLILPSNGLGAPVAGVVQPLSNVNVGIDWLNGPALRPV